MDWVIPIRTFGIEPRDKQTISLDHHLRVGGLHRKYQIMVIVITCDAGKLQRAFHHAERRVAIAVHDAIRERSMIGADAHHPSKILAKLHQRRKFLADAFELLLILRVGVLADFELLLVGVISRVHANFLHPLGGLERGIGLEMDVGHQRHLAAGSSHFARDVFEVRGVNFRLGGDPHNFTARIREREHLGDAGGRVAGVGGDHRLDANRIRSAKTDISDPHFAGCTALVAEQVRAIAQGRGRIHRRGKL